jgi:hypothetical protein
MAGSYITGAFIYGCRIPERILPGRFNYFASRYGDSNNRRHNINVDVCILKKNDNVYIGCFSPDISLLRCDCFIFTLSRCFDCYGILA